MLPKTACKKGKKRKNAAGSEPKIHSDQHQQDALSSSILTGAKLVQSSLPGSYDVEKGDVFSLLQLLQSNQPEGTHDNTDDANISAEALARLLNQLQHVFSFQMKVNIVEVGQVGGDNADQPMPPSLLDEVKSAISEKIEVEGARYSDLTELVAGIE